MRTSGGYTRRYGRGWGLAAALRRTAIWQAGPVFSVLGEVYLCAVDVSVIGGRGNGVEV